MLIPPPLFFHMIRFMSSGQCQFFFFFFFFLGLYNFPISHACGDFTDYFLNVCGIMIQLHWDRSSVYFTLFLLY